MWTLKLITHPTNAFFATSIKCLAAPPSFQLLWALFRCLSCAQRFDYCVLGSTVGSWEEQLNIWLTVAKNAFVGWAFNFRVRMLLKGAVTCTYLVSQGLNVLGLSTVHPGLSIVCPDVSTVHPLLTMKQNRLLIMTWHMIHSTCNYSVHCTFTCVYIYLAGSRSEPLGLPTVHPALSTVCPDESTVHPLSTMKWDIQKRFLIMTLTLHSDHTIPTCEILWLNFDIFF